MRTPELILAEFESERLFRLWDASVSHSLLLFRSPRVDENDHNLDLLFVGVKYLAVAELLRGARITQAEEKDLRVFEAQAGIRESHEDRLFLITSGGHVHRVLSAQLFVLRTTSSPMDSSIVVHWAPRAEDSERYFREYVVECVQLQR